MKKLATLFTGSYSELRSTRAITAAAMLGAVSIVLGYFSIQLVKLLASRGRFGAFAFDCWGAGALFHLLNLMGWTFVPAAAA